MLLNFINTLKFLMKDSLINRPFICGSADSQAELCKKIESMIVFAQIESVWQIYSLVKKDFNEQVTK